MKKALYYWLFPRKCIACGRVIDYRQAYCAGCRQKMPFIGEERCEMCGCALKDCRCKKKKMNYDAVLAPFYYSGGAKHAVLRLKRYPIYAKPLAEECVAVFKSYYGSIPFDAVCAVPMSRQRLKQSSFNHSALLAREIATHLQLPYKAYLRLCAKAKPQHTLPMQFRAGNVRGIYDIIEGTDLQNKTVLLVDDIKTSGATLSECALMLKLVGAKSVYALCVSITNRGQ
ncbi:MAG: ComF family protein [Ruminococcaceae bacterium]|nr:ComF family protein [Oscillospiraceae bacterium]